eukprot:6204948-Pleurochrysis_carterae.AAC.3
MAEDKGFQAYETWPRGHGIGRQVFRDQRSTDTRQAGKADAEENTVLTQTPTQKDLQGHKN